MGRPKKTTRQVLLSKLRAAEKDVEAINGETFRMVQVNRSVSSAIESLNEEILNEEHGLTL